MKRQYLVKDTNKVDEGAKFQILMEELKDTSLETAVEYWCMATGKRNILLSNEFGRSLENIKAIEDKINELNTLLK